MSKVTKGSTNVIVYVKLINPVTGDEETGLTIADLTMGYTRTQTAIVTSAATELAAVTTAHTDWYMKEIDNTDAKGLYRADFPDAAFSDIATENFKVILSISGAAIDTALMEIELTRDNEDAAYASQTFFSNKSIQNYDNGTITVYDTDDVTVLDVYTFSDLDTGLLRTRA